MNRMMVGIAQSYKQLCIFDLQKLICNFLYRLNFSIDGMMKQNELFRSQLNLRKNLESLIQPPLGNNFRTLEKLPRHKKKYPSLLREKMIQPKNRVNSYCSIYFNGQKHKSEKVEVYVHTESQICRKYSNNFPQPWHFIIVEALSDQGLIKIVQGFSVALAHMPFHNFIYAHAWLFMLLIQMSLKAISCVYCKSTKFTIVNVIQVFSFNVSGKIFSAASMLAASFAPVCPHIVASYVVVHGLQTKSSIFANHS